MDDLLQEVRADVKEIKTEVKAISGILEKNTASLIVHEFRTTLAEKRIEKFEAGAKWILGIIATGLVTIIVQLVKSSIS